MYYVYVLVNQEKKIYIGYTSDLRKRIEYHNKREAGFTSRGKSAFKLCYYEAFADKDDAYNREQALNNSSQSMRWLKERISRSMLVCTQE